ncbi:dynein heavy chain-like isoform X2 [Pecten maximus]|uniref:dynein heavy chain-like isoform X2 n=1 Tax=Pecten maximus TaxID=6579 RepID=UPI001457F377|nr:dynein heavy chain-like isoform X2 [Pecten maximus]
MINLLVPHIKSIAISPHVSYSLYPTVEYSTLIYSQYHHTYHTLCILQPTVEHSTLIYSQYHHTYHTLCILLWNTLLTYTVNITTRIILSVSYCGILYSHIQSISPHVSYSLYPTAYCGILYSHIQSISPHVSYSTHIYSQYHHSYHTLCIQLWNTLLSYTVNITTRIILSVSYCGILYSHIQSISPHVSYSLYPTVEYSTHIYSQYHHTYHTLCILLWNTLLTYTVNITTRIILSVSYSLLWNTLLTYTVNITTRIILSVSNCGILYSHIQSISPHVSYSLYPTVEYSTLIYSQYHHTYHTLCILLWNTLLSYKVNITTRIILYSHIQSISPHVSYSLYPTVEYSTHIYSQYHHTYHTLYPTVEYSTHIYSQYHHTYHTLCILLWNTLLTYTVNITTRIILSVSYCGILYSHIQSISPHVSYSLYPTVEYSTLIYSQYHHTYHTLLIYTVNITTRTYHTLYTTAYCGIYSHCVFYQQK